MDDVSPADLLPRLTELNQIGIALSREKDIDCLLEAILVAAQKITNADGGTLYRIDQERGELRFEIVRTRSLDIALGGTTGREVPFYPVKLYDAAGRPNKSMVAAYAVLNDCTVNIADAYTEQGFDFSGTRSFDGKTGYRSQSFLTVPMKNHDDEFIGVLQLINAKDRSTGAIVPFSEADQHLAESLPSQAVVALTNRMLINQLEELFESFINLINAAIDDKSPYTGGHCQRVPTLTMLLAEAAHRTKLGPLKDWSMSERDRYELKIAGLLHDCGKITTPVHVVDKATKLQTIYDRIGVVDTRFEVPKRDAEAQALKAKLGALEQENGRQGLPARSDARADVCASAHHGHCRYLRGAYREGPALQERQDAYRSADHPGPAQARRPHRPGLVRHFHPGEGLPGLRGPVPGCRADRQSRSLQDSRFPAGNRAVIIAPRVDAPHRSQPSAARQLMSARADAV
jgi:hypothetical protein